LISQIRILLGKELENYKGQDKESVTYLDEHFPTLKGLFFGFNRSVAYLPQSNSGGKNRGHIWIQLCRFPVKCW